MKYTIVGSGPSGLSLAYILSLNNIEVQLIEQYDQLGGSWNSQWINGKYFSWSLCYFGWFFKTYS